MSRAIRAVLDSHGRDLDPAGAGAVRPARTARPGAVDGLPLPYDDARRFSIGYLPGEVSADLNLLCVAQIRGVSVRPSAALALYNRWAPEGVRYSTCVVGGATDSRRVFSNAAHYTGLDRTLDCMMATASR